MIDVKNFQFVTFGSICQHYISPLTSFSCVRWTSSFFSIYNYLQFLNALRRAVSSHYRVSLWFNIFCNNETKLFTNGITYILLNHIDFVENISAYCRNLCLYMWSEWLRNKSVSVNFLCCILEKNWTDLEERSTKINEWVLDNLIPRKF